MTGRPVPPGGDALTLPAPPWWWLRSGPDGGVQGLGRAADPAARVMARGLAAGLEVRVLVGERLRTARGLFVEYARAWHFPGYFGHNWGTLENCLVDLAWRPAAGYLCVITGAEHLLRDEPDDLLGLFLDLLSRVGEGCATPVEYGAEDGMVWSRPALPFHTVLGIGTDTAAAGLLARAAAGGADLSAGARPAPDR